MLKELVPPPPLGQMFCTFRMNEFLTIIWVCYFIFLDTTETCYKEELATLMNSSLLQEYSNSDSATSFEGRKCSSVVFFILFT